MVSTFIMIGIVLILGFFAIMLVIDPPKKSHGFIQWKGTDACIDIYCDCGNQFHLDGEFLYETKCDQCNTKYELDSTIKLKKIK